MRIPSGIEHHVSGETLEEVNRGKTSARVFKVGNDRYLKIQAIDLSPGAESLHDEKLSMDWLKKTQIPIPAVLEYVSQDGYEFLLMTALEGQSASEYRADTDILREYGRAIRDFHDSLSITQCGFDRSVNKLIELCQVRVLSGLVDEHDFDQERKGLTARDVLAHLESIAPTKEDLVVCHGDYCMPNLILNSDPSLSGFIDLGRFGVSDRHRDLAIASRDVVHRFGEERLDDFYASYGMQPNPDLVHFYQLVDELF